MKLCVILLSIVLAGNFVGYAQQKTPVNFGKVAVEDFVIPSNTITDSSTNAVIIADLGNTTFKGNDKGWVSYIFKRKTRIKILNKKAFELATVKIPLYTEGDNNERLENITATTYNLENGNVVATKMEKKDLFTEKIDKNRIEQKFTMPGVRENSIIEYSYTVYSDFYFNIPEWSFQNINYPCLWSEYEVNIPSLVGYIFSKTGIHPFYIDTKDSGHENYLLKMLNYTGGGTVDNLMSVSANTVKHRWVMKDVPAFYVENYLFSSQNYIDKIDFQLSETFDGRKVHAVKNTWSKVTDDMLNEKDFASFITEPDGNEWLDKPLESIARSKTSQVEQAKEIYYYLTNNFTCTNYHNKYIKTTLQDVFQNHKGNVGEINLLLTDMLLRKQISASPVVLSTRDYGYNYADYPLLNRLDYVICKAVIDDKVYYLDASRPNLGFGHLPMDCYNGHARVIGEKDSTSVYFLADSLKETKNTFVVIANDADGKGGLHGSYNALPGYMDSYKLRVSLMNQDQQKYFSDLQAAAANELQITATAIDSLTVPEAPVKVHADFTLKPAIENDIIYFNPILWSDFKINPLSAAIRQYPVEMPCPVNQVYYLNMETPAGFTIDEIPKSARVSFNKGQGYFEYLVQQTDGIVQLRSTISMKKAYFEPAEYNSLREFFAYIVKKQNEQIVFKRRH